MKSLDTMTNVTNEEITEFISSDGEAGSGEDNAALARRVLLAALMEPNVQEKLMASRRIEADWKASRPSAEAAQIADDTARLTALQNALRRVTQKAGGFSDAEMFLSAAAEPAPSSSDSAHPAVLEAAQLREAGGGRWVTQTANSLRDLLEAALQAARTVQTLTLGRVHPVRLPCFAPALAAPAAAPNVALVSSPRETITADGVKIEFQQLPGSGNRMRVFVDTTLLPMPHAAANPENSAATLYNVAFLTLVEGDASAASEAETSHHVLVVSLNECGVGFADFVVSSESGFLDAGGKNVLPAPRTGGCNLVSATLSYLPRLPAR